MSDILIRLEVLRRLIEQASQTFPWCGNTAIQKLVYTLEHVYNIDFGYRYGLHHYGPYSFDLANDLSLGEQAGFWRSSEHYYMGKRGPAGGKKFSIEESKLPKQYTAEAEEEWGPLREKLDSALTHLRGLESKQLELAATIHYLQHVQQVPRHILKDVFRQLKPKFNDDDFDWGMRRVHALEESAQK